MTLHLTSPKYHCPRCRRYFRHRFKGVRPRFRAPEAFRLEVFEAHDGGVTQRKLTLTHNISPATVERWYQNHCRLRHAEMANRPCPKVLCTEEHFFTRKRGYATTLVDLKRNKVFDVVLGRSEASLRRYLKALPGRENVRLLNQHFLKVWQDHDPEGRKNRGLISLMRRHEWRLSPEQRDNLGTYLSAFPVLNALYTAKQRLNRLLLLKTLTRKRAEKALPKLLSLIKQLNASPLHRLAKTLTSWLEPIVTMWRFRKSNGPTEGFHNKMEMMSRRAYGFRNFENYRLRVLTHCGWDGIINRV